MSDYYDELRHALEQAAHNRYARRSLAARILRPRRPGWSDGDLRWRPLALLLAGVLVTGSAAAAVVSLTRTSSAPLVGSLPDRPGIAGRGSVYDIAVTPDLAAGSIGWCANWSDHPTDGYAGSCVAAARSYGPIIMSGEDSQTSLVWLIVNRNVPAVRVDNIIVASHGDPTLPNGWRRAVAFVQGPAVRLTPHPRFPLGPAHPVLPIPLNTQGRPIPDGRVPQSPTYIPAGQPFPPGQVVPWHSVNPTSPGSSPCLIASHGLAAGLRQWEVTVNRVPPIGNAAPTNALFSCAQAWLLPTPQSFALSASVLLNARNPHAAAPNLPDMQPGATPGTFTEAGPSIAGVTARRIGNAWLTIQGGTPTQRNQLLALLTISGTAVTPAG